MKLGRDFKNIFHHYGCPVKLVQASLCVRNDIGSSCYHCRDLANSAHASFSVRKNSESSFYHHEGPEKLVHASFSMRRDLESSVHHCGVHVKLG